MNNLKHDLLLQKNTILGNLENILSVVPLEVRHSYNIQLYQISLG